MVFTFLELNLNDHELFLLYSSVGMNLNYWVLAKENLSLPQKRQN
jgi:hypothetical protein